MLFVTKANCRKIVIFYLENGTCHLSKNRQQYYIFHKTVTNCMMYKSLFYSAKYNIMGRWQRSFFASFAIAYSTMLHFLIVNIFPTLEIYVLIFQMKVLYKYNVYVLCLCCRQCIATDDDIFQHLNFKVKNKIL